MATSSNKRIEETATTALKAALLRCPILESFIDTNDKTPSWDGTVFVYKNTSLKKADLLGRAPIQVKGTEKTITSDTACFPCQVSDLNNYYRDGGCIFFLISVNTSDSTANMFYSPLHVYDLKKILDSAGQQKTFTIKLDQFPQDDPKEIASIFMNFVENSRKQTSFIGREIVSLEQLEKSGIGIESLSFNTSGIGLNIDNIGSFISNHDFYLYAKPKGLDIDIPVEKVSNAIVSKPIFGKVMVKGREYYPSYNVLYEKGHETLQIGKGIRAVIVSKDNKMTMNLKPAGTLSDLIRDTSLYIDLIENREITINGVQITFKDIGSIDIEAFKEKLQYYKDIKKMLELLGVKEELVCDNLSEKDEKNIRNFVFAILYNKQISLCDQDDDIVFGAFVIANLSIWIWATRQPEGNYKIENFFDPHPLVVFEKSDVNKTDPVPVSHFLLLTEEAFVHASNMDLKDVEKDVLDMKHHPYRIESITTLMLNVLRGYDKQKQKNNQLLEFADKICNWLAIDENVVDPQVLRLNKLQIAKRHRLLTTKEKIELAGMTDIKNPVNIRCGAYLLLDDSEEAQKCFDELPPETQKEFITYPICHFGQLNYGG